MPTKARCWTRPWNATPPKTPRWKCAWTRKRPAAWSPAWANCIWTCCWNACPANTASRPGPGHPQVILRETVRKEADGQGEFDRELGKEHHFGHVELHVRPLPRGTGNRVLVGDFLPADEAEARKLLPKPLLDAALEGVRDALQSGALTGYPVEDVEVTLTAVERREGQTTVPGCHMAAGMAPARGPGRGIARGAGTAHEGGDQRARRIPGARPSACSARPADVWKTWRTAPGSSMCAGWRPCANFSVFRPPCARPPRAGPGSYSPLTASTCPDERKHPTQGQKKSGPALLAA